MKKILINENNWQTRVAITKDSKLQNIYFKSHTEETLERVFFKGTVTAVLPGIQTAFVDIGQEKAGFLHISEVDRELAIRKISELNQLAEEDTVVRSIIKQSPDIKKIFKEGDTTLVQVSKEPVYEKGAKLTTCFTLPGRFIVLMPNIPRLGVSKKIENKKERLRLKEIVSIHLPEGMGGIIRTTSEGRDAKELIKDIKFLVNTWKTIQKKAALAQPTEKIYEDLELPLQVVRDHLDKDVEAIITDNSDNQKKIYKFVKLIAPEYTHIIKLYSGPGTLFEHFGVEKQIDDGLNKKVSLKSGGSLIIETTEAMTVVDVNTGRFTGKTNLEDTILKTNLEAAEEIVRQLRLRNIGGLIVIDFIDMTKPENRQKLFEFFEKTLKEHDKFQSVVLRISEFGLVQMTRKRSGKTLIQKLTDTCPTCKGLGFIKSLPTECYAILRKVKATLKKQRKNISILLSLNPHLFTYMSTVEYNAILQLEKEFNCKIMLLSDKNLEINHYKLEKK